MSILIGGDLASQYLGDLTKFESSLSIHFTSMCPELTHPFKTWTAFVEKDSEAVRTMWGLIRQ